MTRHGEISKNMRKFLYLEEESDKILIHVCIAESESLELVVFLSDSSSRALGSRWRGDGDKLPRVWLLLTKQWRWNDVKEWSATKGTVSNRWPKPDLILLRSIPKFPLHDLICFASVRHDVSQPHSASVVVPLPKTMLSKLWTKCCK